MVMGALAARRGLEKKIRERTSPKKKPNILLLLTKKSPGKQSKKESNANTRPNIALELEKVKKSRS